MTSGDSPRKGGRTSGDGTRTCSHSKSRAAGSRSYRKFGASSSCQAVGTGGWASVRSYSGDWSTSIHTGHVREGCVVALRVGSGSGAMWVSLSLFTLSLYFHVLGCQNDHTTTRKSEGQRAVEHVRIRWGDNSSKNMMVRPKRRRAS
jgi:hypothetical protein